MGSWRSFRKLRKLNRIVVPALAGAEANPIPADLDDASGFYMGDISALVRVHRTLYEGNQSWVDDPSDEGRKLRDIAAVIEHWRRPMVTGADSVGRDYLTSSRSDGTEEERSAEENFHARIHEDRRALARISWIVVGKTLEETLAAAVSSGWTIEVRPFDILGQARFGTQFAAVRFFEYQDGPSGMTHVESCMHNHPSREDALPCSHVIAALSHQPPTIDDIGGTLLVGHGWYIGTGMTDWFGGLVAFARSGLVVPYRDNGTLWLPWEQRHFKSFSIAEEGMGSVSLREYKDRRALVLDPSSDAAGYLMILVFPFGGYGEEAWVEALMRQGLKRRETQPAGSTRAADADVTPSSSPATEPSVYAKAQAAATDSSIGRDHLPYPGLVFAHTRRDGRVVRVIVDAITAGTAQYPKGYSWRGGRTQDSEGYLSFSEDGVAFYADSGTVSGWYYRQIRSHTVKRGLALRKLTIRGDGFKEVFKIGRDLAANANYILTATQRMSGRLDHHPLPASHETAPPPSPDN